MQKRRMLKPGEVAAIFSVSVHSLYRWEQTDPPAITPVRPSGPRGQRRYKWEDVAALAQLRGMDVVHPDDEKSGEDE